MSMEFLTATNSKYIFIAAKCLGSFNQYHPDIKFNLVCVNTNEKEVEFLKQKHSNLNIIRENLSFESEGHERGYCICSRIWNIKKILKETENDVFYVDADVFLKDNVSELFEITKDVDFMIRAKRMEPFKCNAGMIWVKNTKKNLEIIEEWEDVARRMKITGPNQFILLEKYYEKGLYWSGQGAGIDQLGLNVIIQKYKNEINYQTFPEKFNGISTNEKSLICHMKGPQKHKYFNKRTNELQ